MKMGTKRRSTSATAALAAVGVLLVGHGIMLGEATDPHRSKAADLYAEGQHSGLHFDQDPVGLYPQGQAAAWNDAQYDPGAVHSLIREEEELSDFKSAFETVLGSDSEDFQNIENKFRLMDLDGSGSIGYTEFLAAALGERVQKGPSPLSEVSPRALLAAQHFFKAHRRGKDGESGPSSLVQKAKPMDESKQKPVVESTIAEEAASIKDKLKQKPIVQPTIAEAKPMDESQQKPVVESTIAEEAESIKDKLKRKPTVQPTIVEEAKPMDESKQKPVVESTIAEEAESIKDKLKQKPTVQPTIAEEAKPMDESKQKPVVESTIAEEAESIKDKLKQKPIVQPTIAEEAKYKDSLAETLDADGNGVSSPDEASAQSVTNSTLVLEEISFGSQTHTLSTAEEVPKADGVNPLKPTESDGSHPGDDREFRLSVDGAPEDPSLLPQEIATSILQPNRNARCSCLTEEQNKTWGQILVHALTERSSPKYKKQCFPDECDGFCGESADSDFQRNWKHYWNQFIGREDEVKKEVIKDSMKPNFWCQVLRPDMQCTSPDLCSSGICAKKKSSYVCATCSDLDPGECLHHTGCFMDKGRCAVACSLIDSEDQCNAYSELLSHAPDCKWGGSACRPWRCEDLDSDSCAALTLGYCVPDPDTPWSCKIATTGGRATGNKCDKDSDCNSGICLGKLNDPKTGKLSEQNQQLQKTMEIIDFVSDWGIFFMTGVPQPLFNAVLSELARAKLEASKQCMSIPGDHYKCTLGTSCSFQALPIVFDHFCCMTQGSDKECVANISKIETTFTKFQANLARSREELDKSNSNQIDQMMSGKQEADPKKHREEWMLVKKDLIATLHFPNAYRGWYKAFVNSSGHLQKEQAQAEYQLQCFSGPDIGKVRQESTYFGYHRCYLPCTDNVTINDVQGAKLEPTSNFASFLPNPNKLGDLAMDLTHSNDVRYQSCKKTIQHCASKVRVDFWKCVKLAARPVVPGPEQVEGNQTQATFFFTGECPLVRNMNLTSTP